MLRYHQHFGLQRDPFLDTADPQFFCELPAVRRNAQRVLTGISESRGLTVVIGAPGTGKTSLSASVEGELLRNERVVIGKILDPAFGDDIEFLQAIGRVFGIALPPKSSAQLKNALKNFFFDTVVLEEKTLVLMIDEAQNLTGDGLETLRLLLNFQIPQKKLLNLVLFGQSELEEQITARGNLSDRVDSFLRIDRLDAASAAALLEHRLVKAGKVPTVRLFASDALDLVIAAADGLPRRLTSIARSAMVEASDRGADLVTRDHVIAALRVRGITVPAMKPATPEETPPAAPVLAQVSAAPVPVPASKPSIFQRFFARRT
jgi:type II secretory pathway predicted ATPase ExeA